MDINLLLMDMYFLLEGWLYKIKEFNVFAVVSSGSRQVPTDRLTSLYEMNGGKDEGLKDL